MTAGTFSGVLRAGMPSALLPKELQMIMPVPLANDALLAAIDGGSVAVFAETASRATSIMQDLLRVHPELHTVAEIRRTYGQERLTFPGGGRLSFRTIRGSVRGERFDRCYVPIGTNAKTVDEIRPALATSPDGLITGY